VLEGYTTAAAAVAGTADREGRLVPGMVADITVLGADPLVVDPDSLPDVPVVATVVAGEVVFRGS
jgi:predicted amidohydrolase YtcJ